MQIRYKKIPENCQHEGEERIRGGAEELARARGPGLPSWMVCDDGRVRVCRVMPQAGRQAGRQSGSTDHPQQGRQVLWESWDTKVKLPLSPEVNSPPSLPSSRELWHPHPPNPIP